MRYHDHRRALLTVSALLLSVWAAPLGAQEETGSTSLDRWTPELSMKYQAIQGTALSPDGSHIAYVVRAPVMEGEKSEYRSHIWVVTADGERNAQFTRGDKSVTNPRFSPDGQYLAFTTSRSDTSQVWVMPLMGGEAQPVTNAEAGVSSYAWSPDGRHIAYTMSNPLTEEEQARKKEKRDVILVDKNFKFRHLYIAPVEVDENGERPPRRLTEGDFHVTSFDFSPDGETIAFSHQADPRINTARLSGDISLVTVADASVRHLITTGGVEGNPKFSPDGEWIAYTSTGDEPQGIGLGDVYVVGVDTGEVQALAHTHDRSGGLLRWTGDGSAVLVTEAIRTSRQLVRLPVDGSDPETLTAANGVMGSISFDRNAEKIAFTFQDADTPADVFLSSVDAADGKRLTDLHADVPRPTMGRTEVLTWTSSDGLEVEGLLTYPVDYQAGRTYPLILNVHGGPAGVFSQSFTGNPGIYMIQYFAQEGFAVLRPNPRGSTGYGKEFRYANFQDWGYGDFEDLMSGVDHVIDMGVAAPDSLLLMGWSYGGYMTSFAVTKTNRFRAASMGAGLPNLISMVTTTDIGDYLVAHLGGEFWNDYETYEKHSAMYQIKNVTTPTQVIHGARDLRVPFTQGQEFYRALDRLGVATEMIVYPRTPHGPREPKFLMDVSGRIMTWFNTHLRNPVPTTDSGSGN